LRALLSPPSFSETVEEVDPFGGLSHRSTTTIGLSWSPPNQNARCAFFFFLKTQPILPDQFRSPASGRAQFTPLASSFFVSILRTAFQLLLLSLDLLSSAMIFAGEIFHDVLVPRIFLLPVFRTCLPYTGTSGHLNGEPTDPLQGVGLDSFILFLPPLDRQRDPALKTIAAPRRAMLRPTFLRFVASMLWYVDSLASPFPFWFCLLGHDFRVCDLTANPAVLCSQLEHWLPPVSYFSLIPPERDLNDFNQLP